MPKVDAGDGEIVFQVLMTNVMLEKSSDGSRQLGFYGLWLLHFQVTLPGTSWSVKRTSRLGRVNPKTPLSDGSRWCRLGHRLQDVRRWPDHRLCLLVGCITSRVGIGLVKAKKMQMEKLVTAPHVEVMGPRPRTKNVAAK